MPIALPTVRRPPTWTFRPLRYCQPRRLLPSTNIHDARQAEGHVTGVLRVMPGHAAAGRAIAPNHREDAKVLTAPQLPGQRAAEPRAPEALLSAFSNGAGQRLGSARQVGRLETSKSADITTGQASTYAPERTWQTYFSFSTIKSIICRRELHLLWTMMGHPCPQVGPVAANSAPPWR